jgi:hypothetical protein
MEQIQEIAEALTRQRGRVRVRKSDMEAAISAKGIEFLERGGLDE